MAQKPFNPTSKESLRLGVPDPAIIEARDGSGYYIFATGHGVVVLLKRQRSPAAVATSAASAVRRSISLVTQLYNDFKDYSAKDPNGWNVEDFVHKVYGGEEKDDPTKQIVITTWQSIYKLPKDYFDQFGAVFGDEAHLFKAASLTSIMTKLTNCPYRIALTGTLDGTQTHKLAIEGLFGTVKQVTTTKDLMEKKLLSNLEIDCILLTYPDEICKTVAGIPYQEEIDWIVGCDGRNALISKLACSTKGNTLVLFQFVEKHGKPLYERIKEHAGDSRKVFYVSGETEGEVREEIRQITEQCGDGKIIEFGNKRIVVKNGTSVPLSNGSRKLVDHITLDDDIDDDWIRTQLV